MSGGRKYWTRDLILRRLRECPDPPRVSDWRPAGSDHPNYLTVLREFGSWERALSEAGFSGVGKPGRRKRP